MIDTPPAPPLCDESRRLFDPIVMEGGICDDIDVAAAYALGAEAVAIGRQATRCASIGEGTGIRYQLGEMYTKLRRTMVLLVLSSIDYFAGDPRETMEFR